MQFYSKLRVVPNLRRIPAIQAEWRRELAHNSGKAPEGRMYGDRAASVIDLIWISDPFQLCEWSASGRHGSLAKERQTIVLAQALIGPIEPVK